MLSDPSEKCRELSCNLFAQAVAALPEPAALMPALVPVLCQRLSASPSREPSEEVRLSLVRLLAALTASVGAVERDDALPLSQCICCALTDPFPDIKKVCFSAAWEHAACTGPGHVQCDLPAKAMMMAMITCSWSDTAGAHLQAGCQAILGMTMHLKEELPAEPWGAMITSLIANTSHQHSRIRLASLTAMQAVIQPVRPFCTVDAISTGTGRNGTVRLGLYVTQELEGFSTPRDS